MTDTDDNLDDLPEDDSIVDDVLDFFKPEDEDDSTEDDSNSALDEPGGAVVDPLDTLISGSTFAAMANQGQDAIDQAKDLVDDAAETVEDAAAQIRESFHGNVTDEATDEEVSEDDFLSFEPSDDMFVETTDADELETINFEGLPTTESPPLEEAGDSESLGAGFAADVGTEPDDRSAEPLEVMETVDWIKDEVTDGADGDGLDSAATELEAESDSLQPFDIQLESGESEIAASESEPELETDKKDVESLQEEMVFEFEFDDDDADVDDADVDDADGGVADGGVADEDDGGATGLESEITLQVPGAPRVDDAFDESTGLESAEGEAASSEPADDLLQSSDEPSFQFETDEAEPAISFAESADDDLGQLPDLAAAQVSQADLSKAGESAADDADLAFKLEPEADFPGAAAEAKANLALDGLPQQEPSDTMQIAPAVTVRRNPLWPLLKVAAGALLGLVLIQVGGWWAGFDWFGLAPALPKAMAWMAPAHLRGEDLSQPIRPSQPPVNVDADVDAAGEVDPFDTEPVAPAEEPVDTAATEALAATIESSGSGTSADLSEPDRSVDLEVPADPIDASAAADPDMRHVDEDLASDSAGLDDLSETHTSDLGADTLDDMDEFGTGDRLPAEDPLGDALSIDEPSAPSAMPKLVGPIPPKWFTDQEATTAFREALDADRRLDDAQLSGKGKRAAARDFYIALAKLAERTTYAEPAVAELAKDRTRELLARFEFDDKKLRLIGNNGPQWIRRDLGVGAIVAGTVSAVNAGADLVSLRVECLGKAAASVDVAVRAADGGSLRVGQRLLIVGTILNEPDVQLPSSDFEGKVVWAGLVHTLP